MRARSGSSAILLQGNASYATYLIPPLALHIAFKSLEHVWASGSTIALVAKAFIALLVAGACSTALHLFVERSIARVLRAFSIGRRSPSAA